MHELIGKVFRISVCVIYLFACLWFSTTHKEISRQYPPASIEKLSHFTAERPYQYRVLIPALCHVVGWIIPLNDEGIIITIDTIFLLIALTAGYGILLELKMRPEFAMVLPLLILWPLWYNACVFRTELFLRYYYPYDMPSVAFFAAGLFFVFRQNWRLYYIIYLLACINRETAIFLTISMLLLNWGRLSARVLATHVLAQAAIWVAVFVGVHVAFAGNPGVVNEQHFSENMEKIRDGTLVSLFGWMWMIPALGFALLPTPCRRLLMVTVPFFGLMMYYARIEEARIYNEINVVLMVTSAITFYNLGRAVQRQLHIWKSRPITSTDGSNA